MSSAGAAAQLDNARGLVALELLRGRGLSEARLSRAGFRDMEEVLETVARRFQVPRLELDTIEIEPGLAKLISRDLAERYRMVPAFADDREISVATTDPSQLEVFDWLAAELGRRVAVTLASPSEVDRALRRLYEPRAETADLGDVSERDLLEATQIVDRLIAGAVDQRASDIHVEVTERETVVRYRVDGALRHVDARPVELHRAIISRIKVLARLDISVHHAPQDGRIKLRVGAETVDLRVSVLPTFFGEKVCMRILDNSRALMPLEELGFDRGQIDCFRRMISAPFGLLLVTGPTGSGKSTTLYGALNAVRTPELNFVTVEDPVEYQLPGVNQVQVNAKRGLTFAGALRSILRQDPDVILVGEIRDHETGIIAAEAALTGHLVMASLHTNDAPSAITRLVEMGIANYLIAPSVVGVVAQRLMRRVCSACAEAYRPGTEELRALGLPGLPRGVEVRRGRGCSRCHETGYLGRVAVRELMEIDDETRGLISRGAAVEEIRAHLDGRGFEPMRYAALKRLFAGVTSSREVMRLTRA